MLPWQCRNRAAIPGPSRGTATPHAMRGRCVPEPDCVRPRASSDLMESDFRVGDSHILKFGRFFAMDIDSRRMVMVKPISMDLRSRIVAAVEAGSSTRTVAARFEVSPSAVSPSVPPPTSSRDAPTSIGGPKPTGLTDQPDLVSAVRLAEHGKGPAQVGPVLTDGTHE